MNVVVLKPGEGRMLPLGPIQMVVQEDGTHTRGTLGVAEFEVAPHAPTPPPHIHHAHEEGFYVLEGELEFLAGTETVRAGQGTFVMCPLEPSIRSATQLTSQFVSSTRLRLRCILATLKK